MGTGFDVRLEPLLVLGFAATAIFWLLLSSWVLVDRALYDRRKRRLLEIGKQLSDPRVATLPDAERAATIGAMLARLPRLEVYRLASNNDISSWVREACAAYSIGRIGANRILRDAAGTRKWRRISALHALAYDPPAELHDLLRRALADADPDVASAAATVLQRLGDRRAAEILIGGLREARLPASRIAARLERFPMPLDDVLRPLLADPRPEARYWAATLLRHAPHRDGLAASIVPLADDVDAPVRKAALLALAAMSPEDAANIATRRMSDDAPYDRSAAIHALAQAGERSPDRARRQAIAASIAPALADREWSVRSAAKDGLLRLGPTVWREVANQLSSTDGFARNSAAEVLQNLGVLDWTIRGLASGVQPTPEAIDVLRRALRAGGIAMADAAVLRTAAEPIPAVHELLRTLELQESAQ
jgi:HEAT repeat protein